MKEWLPRLKRAELRELRGALSAALAAAEASPAKSRPEVLATRKERSVVYQLERVRCGKEGCKCSKGNLHGPYWYAYYRSERTGRLVKKYLGKKKKELKPRRSLEKIRSEGSLDL